MMLSLGLVVAEGWVVEQEGFEFFANGFSPTAFVRAEAVVLKGYESQVVLCHGNLRLTEKRIAAGRGIHAALKKLADKLSASFRLQPRSGASQPQSLPDTLSQA